jgi:hypothetical protein
MMKAAKRVSDWYPIAHLTSGIGCGQLKFGHGFGYAEKIRSFEREAA